MTSLPPAPDAIINLVKCDCPHSHCTNNLCKCRKNGLSCTELCGCSNESDECENADRMDLSDDEKKSDGEL